ncbi:MAG: ester cyclase [Alphaproteobacteria bacterium]|nr:ester cyclase [Alphaproteobacteria bacterium]
MRATLLAAVAATLLVASPAVANDKAVVEAFYSGILSAAASPDMPTTANRVLAPTWQSIGDFATAPKTRDQFIPQIQGFGRAVPDIKWVPQQILQEGNRFTVISRATGTPAGAFLGQPHSGRTFDIMSIDVHTVEAGVITRSYHVEDWASAIRQLRTP